MRYELLEEAGQLKVEYNGGFIDAHSMGVLQINVQEIIDKTAFWLLSQEGLLEPTWKRPKYLPPRYPATYKRLVRAEVSEIGTGSLIETLRMAVAAVLNDHDARAVLQNIVACVVWAIGASGVKGVISKPKQPPIEVHPPLLRRNDPMDIGANLRDVALALAENSNGKTVELRFKHQVSREERMEVVIRIEGNNQ